MFLIYSYSWNPTNSFDVGFNRVATSIKSESLQKVDDLMVLTLKFIRQKGDLDK